MGTPYASSTAVFWQVSPCDFHLIPKMKEPLRGIRFRTVPEILQAVDRWQRVVRNAGYYIEGQ